MRRRSSWTLSRLNPRLFWSEQDDRRFFATESLIGPPSVYGEGFASAEGRSLRRWDPTRSKLGAALALGWAGPIPRQGERWLYLGAATGTTASHFADLVGEAGAVYAVEKSPRPMSKLLRNSARFPNLFPILGDARHPDEYVSLVPGVDGVYADVAQPDQVPIAIENSRWFLEPRGAVLLALKTPSLGREKDARTHADTAGRELSAVFELGPRLRLDPFQRGHFLLSGRPHRSLFATVGTSPQLRKPPERLVRRVR